jgi:glycosyltransferase 2 family protein
MGKKLFQRLTLAGSLLLFIFFLSLSLTFFDAETLYLQTKQFFSNYNWLLFTTVCYFFAFLFRAAAWRMYGEYKQPMTLFLYGLYYSLFFNHIFPIKIGDVIRIGVLANKKEVSWDTAAHSVVVMRILDLVCLGLFSFIGAMFIGVALNYSFFLQLVIILVVIGIFSILILKKKWAPFYSKHMSLLREAFFHKKALIMVSLVALSWVLEAAVVYGVLQALHFNLSFFHAIWVNSITVAAQVFQFAPGGLATYEGVMSFALVQINIDWKDAYHAALITHGYKFIFSYVAGAVTFILHPISLTQLKVWRTKKGE